MSCCSTFICTMSVHSPSARNFQIEKSLDGGKSGVIHADSKEFAAMHSDGVQLESANRAKKLKHARFTHRFARNNKLN
jgi:hypothetical protein